MYQSPALLLPWKRLALAAVAWCGMAGAGFAQPPEAPPDFQRDVRPILSDHCFQCHGADPGTREAGLRLDRRDDALAGGDSGEPPIIPGKPDASLLLARVSSQDPIERMPPPDAGKPLSAEQVDGLRRWIAAGAEYGEHWAFIPPERPAAPAVADEAWPRGDLDRFVLARLEKEGLRPAPEADRAKLLRRLSLDLIGLVPSPREIDEFLADSSADAYERQVERLLGSAHFGEKWARHWLDLARYADSDGYEKDLPRNQWLWRDWVIHAINADLPYDQFIIEQLAGDLLPDATQDSRVATGFLRNGMVNEEGAILAEQFRMEGLFDRLDCIGKSVLGLTIQCAQCHAHKYDPIAHEEYYGLLAFLNNDYEATSWVYTPEQLQRIARIREGVQNAEAAFKTQHPDWAQRIAEWEQQVQATELAWETLVPIEHEWIGGLAHPQKLPDNSVLTLGFRPTDGELYVVTDTQFTNINGVRLVALTHGDLPFGGPGRSQKGTFAVSEVVVEMQPAGAPSGPWKKVELAGAAADFALPEQPIDEFFRKGADDKRRVGPAAFLTDGDDATAWGTDRGPGQRHQDSYASLRFANPVGSADATRLKITLRFKHGGADIHGRHNNFLGRFRLDWTTAADPTADLVPIRIRDILKIPADQRTADQASAVFSHWLAATGEFKPHQEAVEKLWADYPEGESVLNLAQRLPEHARETAILDRGDWQHPTQTVTPGTPAFLHPLAEDAGPNRLAFARWLVDRRAPTTARVAVNRVWQAVFGVGLVETAEDFGVRASAPSHPELLDWLAVEFMERGWSRKHLLRLIVTSATYRQSSRATGDLLELDPQNRLLARGPRFRLDAEIVRDLTLSASGLLTERVGGPSFFPPLPDNFLALSYLKVDFWDTASPPDRYRRSLYMFRRRSMPDPLLACFDAPSGDVACARRMRSNTPLAALAALNEPVLAEGARALALRALNEGGANNSDRLRHAFRLCTAREPTPAEASEIEALYNAQKARIADGWLSVRDLTTGDPAKLPDLPEGVTPTEAAAWVIVCRVLLNLDESLTKN